MRLVKVLVILVAVTGMRISEALALTCDVIEYPSTQTRARVQQRLKGFLTFCHDAHWLSHVPRLSAIKVDEPPTMPLSDKQFENLLAQISETFSDSAKALKVRALVRIMRYSGLSIMDAVTLESAELHHDTKKKIFRIVTSHQKTGTHVSVPIPEDVDREAIAVLNGNPQYFFWTGTRRCVKHRLQMPLPAWLIEMFQS